MLSDIRCRISCFALRHLAIMWDHFCCITVKSQYVHTPNFTGHCCVVCFMLLPTLPLSLFFSCTLEQPTLVTLLIITPQLITVIVMLIPVLIRIVDELVSVFIILYFQQQAEAVGSGGSGKAKGHSKTATRTKHGKK